MIVFGAPREDFTSKEVADLTQYLNGGGRVLLLTTDGGDYDDFQVLKSFLERLKLYYISMMILYSSYGISCNNDSVLRSVFYKYLHPKEVFIADGILVPDIARKKVSLTD